MEIKNLKHKKDQRYPSELNMYKNLLTVSIKRLVRLLKKICLNKKNE